MSIRNSIKLYCNNAYFCNNEHVSIGKCKEAAKTKSKFVITFIVSVELEYESRFWNYSCETELTEL